VFALIAEHELICSSLISAWLVPKDISKLQTHEIEAYISEPYKRSGDLLTGYRVALDPKKWEEEHKESFVHTVDDEPEIDELDSEEEGSEGKKQAKSKKRKRDSDAGTIPKSKAKPKAKKSSDEPTGKKKAPNSKTKKGAIRSKAMIESEDEDAGPSKKSSPPPTKKAKRDINEEDVDGTSCSHAVFRHLVMAFRGQLNCSRIPKPSKCETGDTNSRNRSSATNLYPKRR
jgi:hypothetical protein